MDFSKRWLGVGLRGWEKHGRERERMKEIVAKKKLFSPSPFLFFIPFYFKSIFVLKAVVIRSAQVLLHSHTNIQRHLVHNIHETMIILYNSILQKRSSTLISPRLHFKSLFPFWVIVFLSVDTCSLPCWVLYYSSSPFHPPNTPNSNIPQEVDTMERT